VANFRVIGHYFFEDIDGHAVTVTSAYDVEVFRNFRKPELSHCGIGVLTRWFQQDGATAHTARASKEVIWEMFPEHIISLRFELPWPACSLDFSACDYFLWGYFKAKVYH
jgi:hypothetical protein